MAASKIEWTEKTWNPVTGCDKISPGCKFCYAEVMAGRLKLMGQPNYRDGFQVTLQPNMLDLPRTWKKGQRVFVNSMSDLFHVNVPLEYIQQVFGVMVECPQHEFQILTKRAERLANLAPSLPWPANVWMGVSVENAKYMGRMDHLRKVPATVRFVSAEPLLGPLPEMNLAGMHWVIVGGESGHKSQVRAMEEAWVSDIIHQCKTAGVACFVKQMGKVWAWKHGLKGKGGDPEHWPQDLRIREYPHRS